METIKIDNLEVKTKDFGQVREAISFVLQKIGKMVGGFLIKTSWI